MLTPRRSVERGYADHGWLRSHHSFSFADYYDPAHMGFANLRVINEDWIAPGTGFGTHGHRDMEIVTVVLQGELSHKDSLGNGETLRPGEVQRMSAGRGIMHSEFSHSHTVPTHLLQIWIQPHTLGAQSGYEQKPFAAEGRDGRFQLVVSPDGRDGSLSMQADAALYLGHFDGAQQAELKLDAHRRAYVHVALGRVTVNGVTLEAGDALKVENESALNFSNGEQAEVLVFELSGEHAAPLFTEAYTSARVAPTQAQPA